MNCIFLLVPKLCLLTHQRRIKTESLYKTSTNILSISKLKVTYQEQRVTINYCFYTRRTVYYMLKSEKCLIFGPLNRFQKSSLQVRRLKSQKKFCTDLGGVKVEVCPQQILEGHSRGLTSLSYSHFATPGENILNR